MSRLTATFALLVALTAVPLGAAAGEFHPVTATDKQWRPAGAHLTLGAALHLAEAEALTHENLSDFLTPQFRYSHDKDLGYIWAFVYDGKVPKPGNHFLVVVNDRTQQATFMPGE
jgi:hypothetical protein